MQIDVFYTITKSTFISNNIDGTLRDPIVERTITVVMRTNDND